MLSTVQFPQYFYYCLILRINIHYKIFLLKPKKKTQMKKLLILCLLTTGLLNATAQDFLPGQAGMYPELMKFKTNAPSFTKGKVIIADASGKLAGNSNDAVLNTTEKDNLGFEH